MNNRQTNETFSRTAEAGRTAADEETRAARQGADAAQDAMKAGLDTAAQTFQQIADQFTRSLGSAGPQAQELARKSSQNLEVVAQASTVLAQGAQEISREWFSLAQDQFRRNMDALTALVGCRSMQDIVVVQSDLVRDNLQHVINNSRRLSELSGRVAHEATRTIEAQSNDSVRPHRAA